MKDETKTWLDFAIENHESAKILLESKLFNPCLQNVQQSVEKALKSVLIEKSFVFIRTHSIGELKNKLEENGIKINLDDDECDFLDSIYLPSKYPLGSVLPYYEPDKEICKKAILISKEVLKSTTKILK